MSEENNEVTYTQEEMYEALVKQLQQSIDPRDYMTPTQREVAYMDPEQLQTEYELVQSKQSSRGRMQRDLIVSRWEYDQAQKEQENSAE